MPKRRPTSDSTPAFSRTVTAPDRRRYLDFRAGVSLEELATRENVRVDTIQRSIDKMISEQAQFSQEAAEVAARQLFMQMVPDAAAALSGALSATKPVVRKVTERKEDEFGNIHYVDREITEQEPDHKLRLSALHSWKTLPGALAPKTPMVQVDARQQTVNQGLLPGGSQPLALGSGGALSAESIIMQIRRERGLAAGDQAALTGGGSDQPTTNMDRDFELEAEMAEDGDVEDGDLEPEPEPEPESLAGV